jgi:hypothetical protein
MQFAKHKETGQPVMLTTRPQFLQALLEVTAPTQDLQLAGYLMAFHDMVQTGKAEAVEELVEAAAQVAIKWAHDPAQRIVTPQGGPASNGGGLEGLGGKVQ